MAGAIVLYVWLALSVLYYVSLHTPPPINIVVNLGAGLVCAVALAALSGEQLLLKVYLVSFSLATALSSLQISVDQPPFTSAFILFLILHMSVLGLAIAAGSSVATRLNVQAKNASGSLLSLLLLLLIVIAASVAVTKGVRLTGFLNGVKTDGDQYRIAGLSGLQGVITIFLLCCFTSLTKMNRVILVAVILAISVIDVKRGDVVRVLVFLFFCSLIYFQHNGHARRHIAMLIGIGIFTAVIFVIAGEVRQNLYSPGISISTILNSRVGVESIDWMYGYFGINISVLQIYFENSVDAPGYFQQLMQLTFSSAAVSLPPAASIHGFNAGTVFSTFAAANQVVPGADFLVFCGIIALMAAMAKASGSTSMMAFLMLQVFGFVFGNQLILPYYLFGYFAAEAYFLIANSAWTTLPTMPLRHSASS